MGNNWDGVRDAEEGEGVRGMEADFGVIERQEG